MTRFCRDPEACGDDSAAGCIGRGNDLDREMVSYQVHRHGRFLKSCYLAFFAQYLSVAVDEIPMNWEVTWSVKTCKVGCRIREINTGMLVQPMPLGGYKLLLGRARQKTKLAI